MSGTYSPFVFILLRTLLHHAKCYLQQYLHLTHSLCKTAGGGVSESVLGLFAVGSAVDQAGDHFLHHANRYANFHVGIALAELSQRTAKLVNQGRNARPSCGRTPSEI